MLTREQFNSFVYSHSDKLFRLAYYYMNDKQDAEDILQEVLMKLWERKDKINLKKNPEALVLRMVKNKCIDHYRKKRKNPVKLKEEVPDITIPGQALEVLEHQETELFLDRIIHKLPDIQRDILVFRNIEGFSIDKIARLTGLKPNTVEVYLSRARKKVRNAYLKKIQDADARSNR